MTEEKDWSIWTCDIHYCFPPANVNTHPCKTYNNESCPIFIQFVQQIFLC